MTSSEHFRQMSGKSDGPDVAAFTLIELSIVLVIIGLIVGGVLVGQDLIRSAGVRAQVSQFEKFNAAANTFHDKYGYLPGDIPDPQASSFGLQARGLSHGTNVGQGDGNGLIQGETSGGICNYCPGSGESVAFWVDLSTVRLIDAGLSTMDWDGVYNNPSVSTYLPAAKIGQGNFIYVSYGGRSTSDGFNYFGIAAVLAMPYAMELNSVPGLSVQQAYAIDKKIDDGFPQSGNVQALYYQNSITYFHPVWAAAGGVEGANNGGLATTSATPGTSTTCYDNGSTTGATQQYSVEISNGSNVNCALSVRFQ